MTLTWAELRKRYPILPESSVGWQQHPNGGGWVHEDARVAERVYVGEHAVVYGGVFYGGVFYGGVFYGGVFYGGLFYAGEFRGGEFRGGVFIAGEFRGGVFYAGEFRGGLFYAGEFSGGEFRGGVIIGTPLCVTGLLPWTANICAPGELRIGCERGTIAWWRAYLPDLLRYHDCDEHEAAIVRVIDLAEAWLRDNPGVVTEE